MLALLSSRADRLIWGAVAILIAVVLGRALKVIAGRLGERRPSEEHELQQLRTRETAIVLVATAIPYATAIVVLIVLASIFLPVAVLGGSAFLAIVLGFAAQRFLMDIVAGILIGFERWYAVGDFLMLEPTKASGIVEQFGLGTTVLQSLNGDLVYVPNSQIIAAIRSPRGYRRYSIELITSDADAAQRAIEGVGRRGPAGEARFLRPPTVVEVRELGEGTWLVRGRADVPPTMEWLAENLLVDALKAQLPDDVLLANPIVYTLDQGAVARYQRRVLVN
ncbi:MAG: mechanosensitive ion channel family protein [Candidatus Doudnabacteria bacterium]